MIIENREEKNSEACGFKEFEVIPDLWGEENPCQIYVMYIGNVSL